MFIHEDYTKVIMVTLPSKSKVSKYIGFCGARNREVECMREGYTEVFTQHYARAESHLILLEPH